MPDDVGALIDALEDTWSSTVALCSGLDDDQWHLSTGCPGWAVQDNVAHITALELELLGEPIADHRLPDGLAHVTGDIGRHMELGVDIRRRRPGAEVLAEMSEVTSRRLDALRAGPQEGDAEVPGVMGFQSKLRSLLGIRVFDCWAHEQDIRRALGRPGGHDGAAGRLSWARMATGLERVLPTRVADLTERSVLFEVQGADALVVGEGEPAATITVDADTFTALVCGRSDAGPVSVEGDGALAGAVLDAMAITP